jgi:hypothetical protein
MEELIKVMNKNKGCIVLDKKPIFGDLPSTVTSTFYNKHKRYLKKVYSTQTIGEIKEIAKNKFSSAQIFTNNDGKVDEQKTELKRKSKQELLNMAEKLGVEFVGDKSLLCDRIINKREEKKRPPIKKTEIINIPTEKSALEKKLSKMTQYDLVKEAEKVGASIVGSRSSLIGKILSKKRKIV